MKKNSRSWTTTALQIGAAIALPTAAGWIAYSAVAVPHNVTPPLAIKARWRSLFSRAGRIDFCVDGAGPPLLLIHSVNAAASAFEVAPLFYRLMQTNRVYALHLPGFGSSDRSRRNYTVTLFVDAILDMVAFIQGENESQPVDALALSLSAEFLALAAVIAPERFRTIALVAPSGLTRNASSTASQPGSRAAHATATLQSNVMTAALECPLWKQALFDLLVTKQSVRYFLRRAWGEASIDESLFRYAYLTAHRSDACHAPIAFLSGGLFSRNIRAIYQSLTLPVACYLASRGAFHEQSSDESLGFGDNWTNKRLGTGALPQFEQPARFARDYRMFLDSPERMIATDIRAHVLLHG